MPATPGPDPRPGPLAYFLTLTCYGSHLHGQPPYTRQRTSAGTLTRGPNHKLRDHVAGNLKTAAYSLDPQRRQIVLASFRKTAAHRGWTILAAHVRTDHLHLVISASATADAIVRDLKSYASRLLRQQTDDPSDCERWTRSASTRCLTTRSQIRRAIAYTIYQAGRPMTIYDGNQVWPTK